MSKEKIYDIDIDDETIAKASKDGLDGGDAMDLTLEAKKNALDGIGHCLWHIRHHKDKDIDIHHAFHAFRDAAYHLNKYRKKRSMDPPVMGKAAPPIIMGKAMPPIVLDPGHGGEDTGAFRFIDQMREADINLAIAQKLKEMLIERGYDVEMTRDSDKTVELRERTDKTNQIDAQYYGEELISPFVSIHCNSYKNQRAYGAETWCFSKYDDADETQYTKGHYLATAIQRRMTPLFYDRGVRWIYDREMGRYIRRKLWVLRKTKRPAVIVECGFLSHDGDAKILSSEANLISIAERICNGIDEYMKRYYDET